jgi:tRNA modification GTPase
MDRPSYSDELPICALATPFSESALAIVRVSGPGSLELLGKAFSRPAELAAIPSGGSVHGWMHPPGKPAERLDEVVVLAWRAPKGYTGEDGADIIGHGSLPGIAALLDALGEAGFRRALPGEFSLRAFLNGKLDLTRAEAVSELIAAKTDDARSDAVSRLSGALQERVEAIRASLLEALARVHVQLDYALEDDVPDSGLPRGILLTAAAQIDFLRATYAAGRLYREGARVVLAGRTNSGKSSLFNLFLKEERAIVSEVHGTTRDYLEAWIEVGGVPVLLFDTAGFRLEAEGVERAGIERSLDLSAKADIVLYMVDSETGLSDEDRRFLREGAGSRALIPLWSRCDRSIGPAPDGFLPVSATSGTGFPELCRRVLDILLSGGKAAEGSGPRVASERQKGLLDRARSGLTRCLADEELGQPLDAVEPDLRDALDALGEITGQVSSPDLLAEIFSRFCVGK